MSRNPEKYAEIFSTKSNSSSHAMTCKTEKGEDANISIHVPSATVVNCAKDVQEDEQYILNEHTGAMERLTKILPKKCQNCFKYRKSVGVQVNCDSSEREMDKVAIPFGVQCNLNDDNPQKIDNSSKGEMEETTNVGKGPNDSAIGNNIDESYHIISYL